MLDALGGRPHVRIMDEGNAKAQPAPTRREIELAKALRANLRRRKAAVGKSAAQASPREDGTSD